MPRSRSARSPSVSSARLVYSSPRSWLVRSTASSWSSKIDFESNSSRPMSVDLPSSTEPAVANRNMSMLTGRAPLLATSCGNRTSSEVAFLLAVFHGRLAGPVIRPGLAALGDAGGRDLLDDLIQRGGHRLDRTGAAHVAHGAVADHRLEHGLVLVAVGVRAVGQQHAVPFEHHARVREVDGWDLDLFPPDVVPDVELGPVGQGEDADVFALPNPGVVDVPQLGPLVLGVPLAELVAEGDHPFLGPGLFLVAPRAAEGTGEPVFFDRVEQRRGLQPVAAGPLARLLHDPPLVDRGLHRRH